jgi:hypothetical protein
MYGYNQMNNIVMTREDYIDFIMIGIVSMLCMFVSFGWIFYL